jgi:hypothetical protein
MSWLLTLLLGLVIVQAGLLVLDKLHGAAAHSGRGLGKWLERLEPAPIVELSAGQASFLNALRVASCIGLVIIWGALIYLLIHLGASFLTQPWQNDLQERAALWSLIYTLLVLSLMRRNSTFLPGRVSWRLLAFHAFYMLLIFGNACLGIAALIEHT